MARVVAILLGQDRLPGPRSPATARRACRPRGWPSTRSRPARATSSSPPASSACRGTSTATPTPGRRRRTRSSTTQDDRTKDDGRGRRRAGTTRARTRFSRTSTSPWARPPRTSPSRAASAEGAGRVRRAQPEPRREGDRRRLLGARDRPGEPLPDGTTVTTDDGPASGRDLGGSRGAQAGLPPDGLVTAGNCCPLNDGAAAVVIMSDTKATELGVTRWPGSSRPGSAPCPPRSWVSARWRRPSRHLPAPV